MEMLVLSLMDRPPPVNCFREPSDRVFRILATLSARSLFDGSTRLRAELLFAVSDLVRLGSTRWVFFFFFVFYRLFFLSYLKTRGGS